MTVLRDPARRYRARASHPGSGARLAPTLLGWHQSPQVLAGKAPSTARPADHLPPSGVADFLPEWRPTLARGSPASLSAWGSWGVWGEPDPRPRTRAYEGHETRKGGE